MSDIVVIGGKGTIAPLAKSAGLTVFIADCAEDAAYAIQQAVQNGAVIIFITEHLCAQCTDAINAYRHLASPAVIPIPDGGGLTGFASSEMKKRTEKAIGTDNLFAEGNR